MPCGQTDKHDEALSRQRAYIEFFFVARQPLWDQGLLIVEASRSYSDTPHSVGLLWTSNQPGTETST